MVACPEIYAEPRDRAGATGFGQTLFHCDYTFKLATGQLPPSLNDAALSAPLGCLHPMARLPDWLMDLRWCSNDPGIHAEWGRSCWKLRRHELEQRKVHRGLFRRSVGEVFEIKKAEIYVETSLIRGHGTDEEDRKFHPDDERTFVGKQGAVLTRRYDGLCALFPAFTRMRELMKLYAALEAMREQGVQLNPAQKARLEKAKGLCAPRDPRTLYVPRFPKLGGTTFGGVTLGSQDRHVSVGRESALQEDRHVSGDSSRGYAEIQRTVTRENEREVVHSRSEVTPDRSYARAADNKAGQKEDAAARRAFGNEQNLGKGAVAFHVHALGDGANPTDKGNLVGGGASLNTGFYARMESAVQKYVDTTGQSVTKEVTTTMADDRGFFRSIKLDLTLPDGTTPPELKKYTEGSNLVIVNFPDHSTPESRAFIKKTR